jgi:hypothetical protein
MTPIPQRNYKEKFDFRPTYFNSNHSHVKKPLNSTTIAPKFQVVQLHEGPKLSIRIQATNDDHISAYVQNWEHLKVTYKARTLNKTN